MIRNTGRDSRGLSGHPQPRWIKIPEGYHDNISLFIYRSRPSMMLKYVKTIGCTSPAKQRKQTAALFSPTENEAGEFVCTRTVKRKCLWCETGRVLDHCLNVRFGVSGQ